MFATLRVIVGSSATPFFLALAERHISANLDPGRNVGAKEKGAENETTLMGSYLGDRYF